MTSPSLIDQLAEVDDAVRAAGRDVLAGRLDRALARLDARRAAEAATREATPA